MKIRDSGMPDEAYWETLFDVPLILDRLGIAGCRDVAELGCGYGTFSIPIAKSITGTLYTFDIESEMLDRTRERGAGFPIVAQQRDVMALGFGVTADCVLLFNILHCDGPVELLRHAADALNLGGRVLVIHWRYGETPRGPDLSIRPKPVQVIEWARQAGLQSVGEAIDLPPWHYGLEFESARKGVQPSEQTCKGQ
jgi:SAM-dependent methyltransferase